MEYYVLVLANENGAFIYSDYWCNNHRTEEEMVTMIKKNILSGEDFLGEDAPDEYRRFMQTCDLAVFKTKVETFAHDVFEGIRTPLCTLEEFPNLGLDVKPKGDEINFIRYWNFYEDQIKKVLELRGSECFGL